MHLNFWHSLIFAGIVQGLVVAVILLCAERLQRQRRYLGWLVLSFALDNLQYLLYDTGGVKGLAFLMIFVPYGFLCAPLYYLYSVSLAGIREPDGWRKAGFFTPFLIALLFAAGFKIAALSIPLERLSMPWIRMEMFMEYACLAQDIPVLIYLILSRSAFPGRLRVNVLLLVACIAWLIVTLLDYSNDTDYWEIVYLNISIIIYALGHAELMRGKTRAPQINLVKMPNEAETSLLIVRLKEILVDQRRFLDPNIDLEQLSVALGVSKSHLSRSINQELAMSYPEYLNRLRVDEAKRCFSDEGLSHLSVVTIAHQVGFSSKTTFNTAFRKYTGMTPSDFRRTRTERKIHS